MSCLYELGTWVKELSSGMLILHVCRVVIDGVAEPNATDTEPNILLGVDWMSRYLHIVLYIYAIKYTRSCDVDPDLTWIRIPNTYPDPHKLYKLRDLRFHIEE